MLKLLRRLWPFKRGPRCDPSCEHCKTWHERPSFLEALWSSDVLKTITDSLRLAAMVVGSGKSDESLTSVGTTIQIPPFVRPITKWKSVHKGPQFPCNNRWLLSQVEKLKAHRNWKKVTCGNCLRSRLKKQYDKRNSGIAGGFSNVSRKGAALTRSDLVRAKEILEVEEARQRQDFL